jgi:hypothetical protein
MRIKFNKKKSNQINLKEWNRKKIIIEKKI